VRKEEQKGQDFNELSIEKEKKKKGKKRKKKEKRRKIAREFPRHRTEDRW